MTNTTRPKPHPDLRVPVRELVHALSRVEPEDVPGRKARGAFFTPEPIADFLAAWAVQHNPQARILDPTCGDGVFLRAAARRLRTLGASQQQLATLVHGIDIHPTSLHDAGEMLREDGLDANLQQADFFALTPQGTLFPTEIEPFDAIIGNPPFVRYQNHVGDARALSREAALRQGVRLTGLASSWAALLVHACGFLKPDGRLGMVLPAELLTVGYAEPIRRWLRGRFEAVRLVLFDKLQFDDAIENVVLVLANGWGGCEAFSLYHVNDADDLPESRYNELQYIPTDGGKWTDLLLPNRKRQLFRHISGEHFVNLDHYGTPELGTVTGSNEYFTLSESTRRKYRLQEGQVIKVCPPGTRHLKGLSFTIKDWERLRDDDDPVWLLYPPVDDQTKSLTNYLAHGEELGVPDAYKCRVRAHWWRPPVVTPPDLFFTYMSHRYPRLIANKAGVTFLNSMHGVRLNNQAPKLARDALPLLMMNSVTMLGAEVFGRSYGGGILKMEPREASVLPLPKPDALEAAWKLLRTDKARLERDLRKGLWTGVVARVDEILLRQILGLSDQDTESIHDAAQLLRSKRLARSSGVSD